MNNDPLIEDGDADDSEFGDDLKTDGQYKDVDGDDLDDADGPEEDLDRDVENEDGADFDGKDDNLRKKGRKRAGWDDGDQGDGALSYEEFGGNAGDDEKEGDTEGDESLYGDTLFGRGADDEELADGDHWDSEGRDREN
jgi:hypothetical protein